jgi:hypothetical protein
MNALHVASVNELGEYFALRLKSSPPSEHPLLGIAVWRPDVRSMPTAKFPLVVS